VFVIWKIGCYFYPFYSFYFFTWHAFSNCWFYYLYMSPVFLLFVYLLFIHCYCFTNANCIVLHSFILISCLLYLLRHSCFCDVLILTCFIFNCHFTDAGFVKRVCVCVCVCARARARLGLTSGFSRQVLCIKFCLNHFFHLFCISHVGYLILLCLFLCNNIW
jgi:hypothetical protein